MSHSFIQRSFVIFLLFYCSGGISTLEHPVLVSGRGGKEHELDLSAEKMSAMALCQSSLSGAVWWLVIMEFLYELWLLAVYLHLLGYRDHGLHFFQCFLNSFRESQDRVTGTVCLPSGTTEDVPCPYCKIQRIPLIVKLCSHLDDFVIMLVYT